MAGNSMRIITSCTSLSFLRFSLPCVFFCHRLLLSPSLRQMPKPGKSHTMLHIGIMDLVQLHLVLRTHITPTILLDWLLFQNQLWNAKRFMILLTKQFVRTYQSGFAKQCLSLSTEPTTSLSVIPSQNKYVTQLKEKYPTRSATLILRKFVRLPIKPFMTLLMKRSARTLNTR